ILESPWIEVTAYVAARTDTTFWSSCVLYGWWRDVYNLSCVERGVSRTGRPWRTGCRATPQLIEKRGIIRFEIGYSWYLPTITEIGTGDRSGVLPVIRI